MQIVSYVLCFVSAFLNLYILNKCYAKVNEREFNILGYNFIILIVASILIFCINMFLVSKYKILFLYFVMFLSLKFIFKENVYQLLYKSFIFYILLLFCDFLASIFLMFIPFNYEKIYLLGLVKALVTFLETLLFYLFFAVNKSYNFISKSFKTLENKYSFYLNLSIFLFFIMFILITYLNVYNFDFNTFIFVFVIIASFLVLSIILLNSYFKHNVSLKEQKSLLRIMGEYEDMLEKDRINRHEMLNNLLVLKIYENKASIEYEKLLDEIIEDYQSKKGKTYRSLYKLPSGIKGIVYYKMTSIIDKGIQFTSEISNSVYNEFDKFDSKFYYKICKIMGILIDNAIEASMNTEEKFVFIEIYKEDGVIYASVENSYGNTIVLENILKKGYSTKGKNRGYGLHVVSKIIDSTENLNLNLYTNEQHFLADLKITL